ncbi:ROT1 protein [Russula emetica]|nr:ROT1 protein [Russula emetica]
MLLTPLAFLVYASASALAQQAPITYDSAHNVTPITGTWSSGSMNVSTGPEYVYANNQSFSTYPVNTGISFSFNEGDGWFEVLRYRMNGNGTNPNCPTTVLNWSHGNLNMEPNGSIVLVPVGDGFQRIEDPCAANSDFTEAYNDTELYLSWQIFQDPVQGPKLHMFQFDGTPVVPMRLLYTTPNMLPTQRLHNTTQSTTVLKRSITNVAPPIRWWNVAASSTIGAMLGSVLLL